MKNILVALDLKEGSEKVISFVEEFALKFNSKIWLIHVAAPDPDFVGFEPGPDYIRDSRAEDLRKEHRMLEGFASKLTDAGITSRAIMVQGPTVKTILGEAEKLKVDLIVLGFHEHGILYYAFSEKTAFKVLKKSSLPILSIPI